MTFPDSDTRQRFSAARAAVSALPARVEDYRGLSMDETQAVVADLAEIIRVAHSKLALVADSVAHKSRREIGAAGFLQRENHRTLEGFLKHRMGITGQQAVTAVRAAVLLGEAADRTSIDVTTGVVLPPSQPWLAPAAPAISNGTLSIAAAEVIGLGLGAPNSAVTAAQLEIAVSSLMAESIAGVDPDRLRKRARELRDELDIAGVKLREEERHALRNLKHWATPNGGEARLVFDTEGYALFKEYVDRAVSPKLRGVRFVNEQQKAKAETIEADPRTIGQLALDAFVQLLAQGADFDTSFMLGTGAAVIRVTVAEADLQSGDGVARIDGQDDPISIETVKRLMCEGIIIRMGFDQANNVLDLEKEQRLFSRRQREALAVKFGGCMDADCDRPPSWCEAHHILQWERDGGKTEIQNGILLCKHHHLKYHNEGWEVIRDPRGGYWLIPPVTVDPRQTPRPLLVKSRALKDLWRHRNAS